MADQRLRQRGWSIQSSDDNAPRPDQRARAESSATDPSLSHEDKIALMNSAFDHVTNDDDDIVIPGIGIIPDNGNCSDGDSAADGEESHGENDEDPPKKKKRKLLSSSESKPSSSGTMPAAQRQRPHVELTEFQREKLDLAKSKLSKWAARLFDPNRIRGLVEPPQT